MTAMKLSVQEAAARAASIQSELETYINPEKREYLPRFFKTGPGRSANTCPASSRPGRASMARATNSWA